MRLELAHVTAGYGAATVLRDVSLVVPSGSVVALLGPNGAGKTTLLRVASNLLAPRSGRVLVDGYDVAGVAPERLAAAGVCHITGGSGVFRSLTVEENLRLFAHRAGRGDGVERAVRVFPRLGDRLGQTAGTLSGGEQQMLAMARAHVLQAPLVLVDEPSLGLAPIVVDQIFDFLATIAGTGSSVLLVEQYVARALDLADMVYVLVRGRIVFAGEPAEVAASDVLTRYLGPAAAPTAS